MAVLKGIQVDEFSDVTILIFEQLSIRNKKVGNRVHVVISELAKDTSEVLVELSDESQIMMSDKCANVDMIIDFPSEKAIDRFIAELQELKKIHYNG